MSGSARRLEEQHHQVVERRILLARSAHPTLVAVAQGGLVAVVPVGDRDRRGRGGRDQPPDGRGLVVVARNDPQSVAHPVVVHEVGRRHGPGDLPEQPQGVAARVRVQPDDRAEVRPGRAQQLVAILLGPGQRPFVRQDASARDQRLESEPPEEPALGPLDVRAGDAVGLLVDVQARLGVLAEGAVGAPRGERPRGPPIPVVGLVAELVGRQVQTHHVVRVARHQGSLLVG